ncbi:MAG: cobalamin-binding protein [Pelolinea sp.]|jgi:5-methyltetrahydrofolate--homocysteine methyltransferase|nr:cobalamin-binding protein [Pelolinea sp.]
MGIPQSDIYTAILEGDETTVTEQVEKALQMGIPAGVLLNETLIPAMAEVGDLFEKGEYFVPEMLIAARAMKAGLSILKPLLAEAKAETNGKIAIGTVKGDLHDIGKNLVTIMLEGAGFEVLDLGVDVPAERFVEVIEKEHVDMVAMSALLTTTMVNIEMTMKMIGEKGLRDKVKIMVGGAPLTREYARSIGADGFAADASQAAKEALVLLGGK